MKFNDYEKKVSSERLVINWEEDYDFEVSSLVTEARLHAGLTQKQLADKIGTRQSSIARAERGSVPPGHSLLKRIARGIGTHLIPPRFAFMTDTNSFTNEVSVNQEEKGSSEDTLRILSGEGLYGRWSIFVSNHAKDSFINLYGISQSGMNHPFRSVVRRAEETADKEGDIQQLSHSIR